MRTTAIIETARDQHFGASRHDANSSCATQRDAAENRARSPPAHHADPAPVVFTLPEKRLPCCAPIDVIGSSAGRTPFDTPASNAADRKSLFCLLTAYDFCIARRVDRFASSFADKNHRQCGTG